MVDQSGSILEQSLRASEAEAKAVTSESDSEEDDDDDDDDDDEDDSDDDDSEMSDMSDCSDSEDDEEAMLAAEEVLADLNSRRGNSRASMAGGGGASSSFRGGGGSFRGGAANANVRSDRSVSSMSRLVDNKNSSKPFLGTAPFTIRAGTSKKALPASSSNGNSNGIAGASPGTKRGGLTTSVSNPNLEAIVSQLTNAANNAAAGMAPREIKLDMKNQAGSSAKSLGHISQITSAQEVKPGVDDNAIKPDLHLAKLLNGPECETVEDLSNFAHDGLEGFYLPIRDEYIQAWTNKITYAIRNHDLATLQAMHARGERLQACNQFGESVIHLCIRRGTPEILRFLIQDAGVSVRVADDYGRNPLHDACWSLSGSNNVGAYQMMALLLTECPMELLIKDQRNFTPLSYVPRRHWADCNAFLDRQHRKGRLDLPGAK